MNPNRTTILAIAAALALFAPAGAKSAAPSSSDVARQLNDAFVSVAERVRPSVVSIYSEKVIKMRRPEFNLPFGEEFFRFFGDPDSYRRRQQPQQSPPREYKYHQGGMGSGIIVDKEGHILTNNHVVDDADELKVTLADKRIFVAEIVGTDPKTDLAVIKIKGKVPNDLPVAELGDSDAVRIGEMVLAIGAPFGYAQTVTQGIISAKGRSTFSGSDNYEDFIQTDAAINPGNSGGPLVNLDGKIIGINSAIATRVCQFGGVGFAIPSNMAKGIWPTLAKGGKISRGQLGVIIQNIDQDLKEQFKLATTKGAVVSQVNKDSAAEKAGIKVGDVIVRYNGKEIEDVSVLRNIVAGTAPGTKVDVVVMRDGREKTLTAKLGELPSDDTEAAGKGGEGEASSTALGISVEGLTSANAKQFGFEKEDQGVVVREVEDSSQAAEAGLRVGDLITEVNREKVASVQEFNDALKQAKDKSSVLMLIKAKGASRFVIIKRKPAKD